LNKLRKDAKPILENPAPCRIFFIPKSPSFILDGMIVQTFGLVVPILTLSESFLEKVINQSIKLLSRTFVYLK